MNEALVTQILPILTTFQQACQPLYDSAVSNNLDMFLRLYQDIRQGLSSIVQMCSTNEKNPINEKRFDSGCRSCLSSLLQIYSLYTRQRHLCLRKIEFELLPLLQELYFQFYYYGYLGSHPEKMEEYNQRTIKELCGNNYIDDAVQSGQYKYDLSIVVLAYNKLEYTRQCVESLLSNLPKYLRYELIFVNHGSTDGTKEYFSKKSPDKQLDIAVNGGGAGAFCRVVEGEFTLMISNDVVIGPNAIENLLACIRSDPKIAWVVATTPNISNFQTIPASYRTMEQFQAFARQNNYQDSFRWEQRVRLCNPIDIRRNSVFYSSSGLCMNGRFHSFLNNAFPDDRVSLFLRRNGYKMMLAKDAYCHHFGSVTLKNEVEQQGEQEYYLNGRKEFYQVYSVDPWGTGFCFAVPFMERVVENELVHVDILGINCGLGANSLKIKEQIKEYCHNTDVTLYNVTDLPQFVLDLRGISEHAQLICDDDHFLNFMRDKTFRYIIWEDVFLPRSDMKTLMSLIKRALHPNGKLFFKRNRQFAVCLEFQHASSELGDGWFVYSNRNDLFAGD